MNIVISQPMFVPWIGLFEQIKLADVFVHYDDVQMPQGRNFISRVQIKTPRGQQWLSSQLDKRNSGNLILETNLNNETKWRNNHINLLKENYNKSPYCHLMLELAADIYSIASNNLSIFNQHAIELLSSWLDLKIIFETSSTLSIPGQSTQRLIDICKHYNATNYITGLGALNYLNHDLFEENSINVKYMNYKMQPYKQLFGDFIPYVSILDAIANIGEDTKHLLISDNLHWKNYISRCN